VPVARRDEGPLGVVYTPAETARAMVEIALGPLLAGKSVDELLALRVCDPAAGEGAFLVEVVERIARHIAAHGWSIEDARRAVRATCVVGVDIDPRAVETVRGMGIEQVRVGDALAIDWRAAFGIERFDVVIGNPPYIRQEHLV
jgi:methylase of polypeptide subunit release factors